MKDHTGISSVSAGLLLLVSLLIMQPSAGQTVDRSTPPKPEALPAFRIAPLQRLTLSNGLEVLFMGKREVPLIHMNMIIRAGSVNDGDMYGLASMTGAMMDEGAGGYDALQLADQIDFLGASIGVSVGYHTTTLTLHTPLSKLDSALPLFSMILLEPAFPEQELDRLRKERLTSFLQWRDEPRAIASYAFDRVLFGTDHPYGHPIVGEQSSVSDMTRKDLVEFYSTYFTATNAALVVVGDITKEELLPKLEEAIGAWKRGRTPVGGAWKAEQVRTNMVYLIDKPGAAQSEIIIGRIGVDRKTGDYYDIMVMNTVLGGSFASRLNQNLREEHGYTYGARSAFSMRQTPGPFRASASVQTDVTDKALGEFMKELNGILEPVPAEELDRAKNYVGLRYPENFQSVSRIASQLDDVFSYGIPESYFNDFMANVSRVTVDGTTKAARKHITPNAFVFIIVGDRAVIGESVEAMSLGQLTHMTIEYVLGPAPRIE